MKKPESVNAQSLRVLENERAGAFENSLEILSPMALVGYALGTGDVPLVEALIGEIAIRLRSIRAALASDIAPHEDLCDELYMLERRAEVARELVRRETRGASR